jgi:hypothetical protein
MILTITIIIALVIVFYLLGYKDGYRKGGEKLMKIFNEELFKDDANFIVIRRGNKKDV